MRGRDRAEDDSDDSVTDRIHNWNGGTWKGNHCDDREDRVGRQSHGRGEHFGTMEIFQLLSQTDWTLAAVRSKGPSWR